ncbi:hypothetical protein PM082_007263 [Marasmius tenuissimus]|nr:hypothetical protein PM082_007263 [Marasmius tenuissimus]
MPVRGGSRGFPFALFRPQDGAGIRWLSSIANKPSSLRVDGIYMETYAKRRIKESCVTRKRTRRSPALQSS